MRDDFEEAFSDFLDRQEYDQAETALFDIVRTAFLSGWKAAGGDPLPAQKIFKLLFPPNTDSNVIENNNLLKNN